MDKVVLSDPDAVLNWLEATREELNSDNIIIRDKEYNSSARVPVWMALLRELVLTSRWEHVPEILENMLTNEAVGKAIFHGVNESIKSVAIECLLQSHIEKSSKIFAAIKRLSGPSGGFDSHVVILTFFLYLLSQGRFEEAKLTQNLPKIHHTLVDVRQNLKHVMMAYKGLLAYVEWSKEKANVEKLETADPSQHELGDTDQILFKKRRMGDLAETVVECTEYVEPHRGVWDIFISKQIEILVYLEEIDKAEEAIRKYAEKQPDNYFAQHLMYTFYTKHNYNLKLRLNALEKVVSLAPFDDLVLELYQMYKSQQGAASKRKKSKSKRKHKQKDLNEDTNVDCPDIDGITIENHVPCVLLFDLLDYPQWKDNTTVWKYLAEELEYVAKDCCGCEAVRQHWEDRRYWWPDYCFKNVQKGNVDTAYWKIVCAAILFGEDHLIVTLMLNSCKARIPHFDELQSLIKSKATIQTCSHLRIT